MPFGLGSPPGTLLFDSFYAALVEALGFHESVIKYHPRRLWVVAGSGFLMSVLHHIWPDTEFMVVQVGRKIYPDQLEKIKHQFFVAPEPFADNALRQPPYDTVPWYDAKLWQFVEQHGEDGDYIWNVGKIPKDVELTVREARSLIASCR